VSIKKIISAVVLAAVALPIIAQAQTITQGYDIDSDVSLQRGMVVGLKQDDPKKIEAINNSDAKRVHGVVVGSGDSSFILAEENQKVYVASAGKFDVLVSNQNGAIAPGDFVSVSQVTGIAMKTDGYQETVIGKALDGFDGTTKLSEVTIKDAIGAEQKIAIGRISVDLSIMRNPILKSTASLPSYLKDASEFIAGKPVNPVRVYLSLAIMVIAGAVSGSLIYSGIRSGMIAIGRNPLSKKSIVRGIIQVVIVGLIIFLVGVFGVYLLLKL
jgi:hypothetical protein